MANKTNKKKILKGVGATVGVALTVASVIGSVVSCASDSSSAQPTTTNNNNQNSAPKESMQQQLNENISHNLRAIMPLNTYLCTTAINAPSRLVITKNTIKSLIQSEIVNANISGFNSADLVLGQIKSDILSNTLIVQASYNNQTLKDFIVNNLLPFKTFEDSMNSTLSTVLTAPKSLQNITASQAVNGVNYASTSNTIQQMLLKELSSNVNFVPANFKITNITASGGKLNITSTYLNPLTQKAVALQQATMTGFLSESTLVKNIDDAISQGFKINAPLNEQTANSAQDNQNVQQAIVNWMNNACSKVVDFNKNDLTITSISANQSHGTLTINVTYNKQALVPFVVSGFITPNDIISKMNMQIASPTALKGYWNVLVSDLYNKTSSNNPVLNALLSSSTFNNNHAMQLIMQAFIQAQQNVTGFNAALLNYTNSIANVDGEGSISISGLVYDNINLPTLVVNDFVSTTTLINNAKVVWADVKTPFNDKTVNQVSNDELDTLSNELTTAIGDNTILKTNFLLVNGYSLINIVRNSNTISADISYFGTALPVVFSGFDVASTTSEVAAALGKMLNNTEFSVPSNCTTALINNSAIWKNINSSIQNQILQQLGFNSANAKTGLVLKITQSNGAVSTITIPWSNLTNDLSISVKSTNLNSGTAQITITFNNNSHNDLIDNGNESVVSVNTLKGFITPQTLLNNVANYIKEINLNQEFYAANLRALQYYDTMIKGNINANSNEALWKMICASQQLNVAAPKEFNNLTLWTNYFNTLYNTTINSYQSYVKSYLQTAFNKISANGIAKMVINNQTYTFDPANIVSHLNIKFNGATNQSGVSFTYAPAKNNQVVSTTIPFSNYASDSLFVSATSKLTDDEITNMLNQLQPTLSSSLDITNQEVGTEVATIYGTKSVQSIQQLNANEFAKLLNSNDSTLNTLLASLIANNYTNNHVYVVNYNNHAVGFGFNMLNSKYPQMVLTAANNFGTDALTNNYFATYQNLIHPTIDTAVNGNGFVDGVNALSGQIALTVNFGVQGQMHALTFNKQNYVILGGLKTQSITFNTANLQASNQNSALNGVWLKDETGAQALDNDQLANTKNIILNLVQQANATNPLLKWINWKDFDLTKVSVDPNNSTILNVQATYLNQTLNFNVNGLIVSSTALNSTISAKTLGINNLMNITALINSNDTADVSQLLLNYIQNQKISGFNMSDLAFKSIQINGATGLVINTTYKNQPWTTFNITGMLSWTDFVKQLNQAFSTILNAPKSLQDMLSTQAVNSTNLKTTTATLTPMVQALVNQNANYFNQYFHITKISALSNGKLSISSTYTIPGVQGQFNTQSATLNNVIVQGLLTTNTLSKDLDQALANGFKIGTPFNTMTVNEATKNDANTLKQTILTWADSQCKNITDFNSNDLSIVSMNDNNDEGTISGNMQYTTSSGVLTLTPFTITGFTTPSAVVKAMTLTCTAPKSISGYWTYIVANEYNQTANKFFELMSEEPAFSGDTLQNTIRQAFINAQPKISGFNSTLLSFKQAKASSANGVLTLSGVQYNNIALNDITITGFVSSTMMTQAAKTVLGNVNTNFATSLPTQITSTQLEGFEPQIEGLINANAILKNNFLPYLQFYPYTLNNRVNNTNTITATIPFLTLNLPITFSGFNSTITVNQLAKAINTLIANRSLTLTNWMFTTIGSLSKASINSTESALLNTLSAMIDPSSAQSGNLTLTIPQPNGTKSIISIPVSQLSSYITITFNSSNVIKGTANITLTCTVPTDHNPVLSGTGSAVINNNVSVDGFATASDITNALNNTFKAGFNLNNTFSSASMILLNEMSASSLSSIRSNFINWYNQSNPIAGMNIPTWLDNSTWVNKWNNYRDTMLNSLTKYVQTNIANQSQSKVNTDGYFEIKGATRNYMVNINELSYAFNSQINSSNPNTGINTNAFMTITYAKSSSTKAINLTGLIVNNDGAGNYGINTTWTVDSLFQPYLAKSIDWSQEVSAMGSNIQLSSEWLTNHNNYHNTVLNNVSVAQFVDALNSESVFSNQRYATNPIVSALNGFLIKNFVSSQVFYDSAYMTGTSINTFSIIPTTINGYQSFNIFQSLPICRQNLYSPYSYLMYPRIDTSLNTNGFVNGVNVKTGSVAITLQLSNLTNPSSYTTIAPTGQKYIVVSGLKGANDIISQFNTKITAPKTLSNYWSYIVANEINHNDSNSVLQAFSKETAFANNSAINSIMQQFISAQPDITGYNSSLLSFANATATNEDGSVVINGATYEGIAIGAITVSGFVNNATLIDSAKTSWAVGEGINTGLDTILNNQASISQLQAYGTSLTKQADVVLQNNFLLINNAYTLSNRVNNANGTVSANIDYLGVQLPVVFSGFDHQATVSQLAQAIAKKLNTTSLKISANYTSLDAFSQFKTPTLNSISQAVLSALGQNSTNLKTGLTLDISINSTQTSIITIPWNEVLSYIQIGTVSNINAANGTLDIQLNCVLPTTHSAIIVASTTDSASIQTMEITGFITANQLLTAMNSALNNSIDLQGNFYATSVMPLTPSFNNESQFWQTNWTGAYQNQQVFSSTMPSWLFNSTLWTKNFNAAKTLFISSLTTYMNTYFNTFFKTSNQISTVKNGNSTIQFNLQNISYDIGYFVSGDNGGIVKLVYNHTTTSDTALAPTNFANNGNSYSISNEQLANMLAPTWNSIANWNTYINKVGNKVVLPNNKSFTTPLNNIDALTFSKMITSMSTPTSTASDGGIFTSLVDGALSNFNYNQVWAGNQMAVLPFTIDVNGYKQDIGVQWGVGALYSPLAGAVYASVDSNLNGNGFVDGVNPLSGEVALNLTLRNPETGTSTTIDANSKQSYFLMTGFSKESIVINTANLQASNQKSVLNSTWLKDLSPQQAITNANTNAIVQQLIAANNTDNPLLKWINWNELQLGTPTLSTTDGGAIVYSAATYDGVKLPSFSVNGLINISANVKKINNALSAPLNINQITLKDYTPYSVMLKANNTTILNQLTTALKTLSPLITNPTDLVWSTPTFNASSNTLSFKQNVGGTIETFSVEVKGFISQSQALSNLQSAIQTNLKDGIWINRGSQYTFNNADQYTVDGKTYDGYLWIGDYYGQNKGIYSASPNLSDLPNSSTPVKAWTTYGWSSASDDTNFNSVGQGNHNVALSNPDAMLVMNNQLQQQALQGITNFYGYESVINNVNIITLGTGFGNNNYHEMQYLSLSGGNVNLNFANLQTIKDNTNWNSVLSNQTLNQPMMSFTKITAQNVLQIWSDYMLDPDYQNTSDNGLIASASQVQPIEESLVGTYVESMADDVPYQVVYQNGSVIKRSFIQGTNADLSIPNTYNNVPVSMTTGFMNTYNVSATLNNVQFGSNIKVIAGNSFSNINFSAVQYDNNLQMIGKGAFASTVLPNFNLPNSVQIIPNDAFTCSTIATNLPAKLTLPSSLIAIGSMPINWNNDNYVASTLVLPANLQTVGSSTFDGLSVNNIVFDNKLQTIQSYAFMDTNITSLTLPNSLKSIGNSAFAQDQMLGPSVSIPASVQNIGNYIFTQTNVDNIKFNNSNFNFTFTPNNCPMAPLSFFIPNIATTWQTANAVQKQQFLFGQISILNSLGNETSDNGYKNTEAIIQANINTAWWTHPDYYYVQDGLYSPSNWYNTIVSVANNQQFPNTFKHAFTFVLPDNTYTMSQFTLKPVSYQSSQFKTLTWQAVWNDLQITQTITPNK